jgi:hypothetical protein
MHNGLVKKYTDPPERFYNAFFTLPGSPFFKKGKRHIGCLLQERHRRVISVAPKNCGNALFQCRFLIY